MKTMKHLSKFIYIFILLSSIIHRNFSQIQPYENQIIRENHFIFKWEKTILNQNQEIIIFDNNEVFFYQNNLKKDSLLVEKLKQNTDYYWQINHGNFKGKINHFKTLDSTNIILELDATKNINYDLNFKVSKWISKNKISAFQNNDIFVQSFMNFQHCIFLILTNIGFTILNLHPCFC